VARSSDTLAAWRSVLTSHPGADCAARALERARDLEVREQAETVRPAERPAPPVPTVLSGVRAAASKAIPDYPASHLADGNLSTAWQTHFKDTAFIDIDLGDTATVSRVSIANGYQKFSENYGDLLPKNARIAAATLLFDDGSRVPMRLKALSRGYEEVTFSPRKSRILRIEIDSIHRGDTYETDLCVSEIRVYGSR